MIVGALDPGVSSGIVIADLPEGGCDSASVSDLVLFAGEVDSGIGAGWGAADVARAEVKACNVIGQIFGDYGVEHWVIEDFILQPSGSGFGQGASGARSGLSPVRVTNMILFGLEFGAKRKKSEETSVTFQMPSVMTVITDERLRRWNMFYKGKKDARQAAKHLLVFNRELRKA